MVYIFLFLYFISLVGLYIFIMKRMKVISYRHMTNTTIESLGRGYEIIRRRLILVLILLFLVSSIITLRIYNDELFQKIGLYDNKETLGDNAF